MMVTEAMRALSSLWQQPASMEGSLLRNTTRVLCWGTHQDEGTLATFFLGIKKCANMLGFSWVPRGSFRFYSQVVSTQYLSMVWVTRKGRKDEQLGV